DEDTVSRRLGRNRAGLAAVQELAQSLVVTKDEHFVLLERATPGATKLIAPELGNVRPIEEVPCIERAVAQILVRACVELVGSRFGGGVDDAARGPAVFG